MSAVTNFDGTCIRCKKPIDSTADDTVPIHGDMDNRDMSTSFDKTLPVVVALKHRRCPR